MHWSTVLCIASAWSPLIGKAIASHGDDLYAFSDCVYQCEQVTCHNNHYYEFQWRFRNILKDEPDFEFKYYNGDWEFDSIPLPLHLRLLGWTCELNCDYQCQRIIHQMRKDNNEELYQYHGKWPFLRVYGIQELVSAIFSVGNFYVNWLGFKRVFGLMKDKKLDPRLTYANYNVLFLAVVSMMAWTFSTIFHFRDYDLTEKLDYYFAGLTVLSGFHFIASRLLGLFEPGRVYSRISLGAICVGAYACHVYRLVNDWSYTYNMQANIAVGVLQNGGLGLLVYSLYSKFYAEEQAKKASHNGIEKENIMNEPANLSFLKYTSLRRVILPSFYANSPKLYSLYPLLLSTIVMLGMSLEVFDFPPFFFDLVDAHALWHLVTIFPAYYGWFDWLVWDINENILEKAKSD
ncbi:Per1-domain-containing protein [Suhomyces tanzawaensis NRRL Y-17324]|uniref:Post-GPI attachment to proteins factor 3 n=1 Tax=Suhomyces tanzawaensis NRRL Y-17324 TaxID=984487 RepID=A0A1E4SPL2_9ASCO|nr:Per1-domain-containing protein [Suhomyces tanzawaensis NRRL Y-17324]ODV81435.1 Per1-domain-containing protein [Suhomyces tanzawaensis NRRL Y-17324]